MHHVNQEVANYLRIGKLNFLKVMHVHGSGTTEG